MKDESTKFLISVIPLIRLPLTRDQEFFYTSKSQIPFGSFVNISIGNRNIKGVVTNSKKDFSRIGGMQLKPIKSVIKESYLTKSQYELAKFISSYYFAPLGIVIKYFLPKIVSPKTKEKQINQTVRNMPTIPKFEKACILEIEKTLKKNKTCTLKTTYNAFFSESLILIINNQIKNNGSVVIFVPERTLIPIYQNLLLTYFQKDIVITLSSNITKGHFFEKWQQIKSNHCKIILSTKIGLFAPFVNVSLIILAESHDISFKQWAKIPKYDVRTCAKKLAELHNANFLSISPSLRISDIEIARHNKTLISMPQNNIPKTIVIDMKMEYFEKNKDKKTKKRPVVSEMLIKSIKKTLSKGKQVLIFINRQGKNSFSVCSKCKTVFRCKLCERALIERTNGSFYCLHCNFSSDIFPKCYNCKNISFINIGIGTEQLEETLKKIFPTYNIARVDSQSMLKSTSYEKLFKNFYNGDINIVIGTQMATKGWYTPNLALAAVIDMDQLLNGTDYDTDEKAYAHLLQLGSRVGMFGELIIQAYNPLHNVVESAKNNDWHEFLEDELFTRKLINLPPYSQIIKITYESKFENEAKKQTELLYNQLIDICKNFNLTISEPHKPLVSKVKEMYKMQLIITIKKLINDSNENLIPKDLKNKLITLDTNWKIDIDPVNIT